jgi:hypothetical protein
VYTNDTLSLSFSLSGNVDRGTDNNFLSLFLDFFFFIVCMLLLLFGKRKKDDLLRVIFLLSLCLSLSLWWQIYSECWTIGDINIWWQMWTNRYLDSKKKKKKKKKKISFFMFLSWNKWIHRLRIMDIMVVISPSIFLSFSFPLLFALISMCMHRSSYIQHTLS